jgi:uncharacterized membrane protein HdeD (DUF308 family)
MSDLLSMYRYIVGIGVPVAFAGLGALGKKLIRKGGGWQVDDFYLGIELTLAGIANGLVGSFDLLKLPSGALPQNMVPYAVASAVVTFCGFFCFLFLLSIHQDWESKESDQKGKMIRLGIVSNVVGLVILFASIMLVPGLG